MTDTDEAIERAILLVNGLPVEQLGQLGDAAQRPRHGPGADLLNETRLRTVVAWRRYDLPLRAPHTWSPEHNTIARAIARETVAEQPHELWQQFIQLGAWHEDPPDGRWPSDLSDAAHQALAKINTRLIYGLTAYAVSETAA